MLGISIGRKGGHTIARSNNGVTNVIAPLESSGTPGPSLHLSTLTDFPEFFAPLYTPLDKYSWLVDRAKFSFPEDEDARFGSNVVAQAGDCRYFRPGSLSHWSRFLFDDWCTLVAFEGLNEDADRLVRSARGKLTDARILTIVPRAECVFHCIDGVRWTFYATDETLVQTVEGHVASRTDLVVRRLSFGDDVR